MKAVRKTNITRYYDPLNINDRWRAGIDGDTAKIGECPFYDIKLTLRCGLTKEVYHVEDCGGRCFSHGFCCSKIQEREK
jgi:hypothetical protein